MFEIKNNQDFKNFVIIILIILVKNYCYSYIQQLSRKEQKCILENNVILFLKNSCAGIKCNAELVISQKKNSVNKNNLCFVKE